ncbi:Eco57I restriction-modification methylase domain-containing protein [Ruminobacter sp. RM87]|uniref:Eco57I restriction-modification methylase domain-containing protein n=1 Tax=Ruminobacter sp. RM87 TaxID=1200567 RepID=UPI00068F1893|nr:Eco57I restriction-modification methylase domain-containing protein [Ruminobacter sp. RM87]
MIVLKCFVLSVWWLTGNWLEQKDDVVNNGGFYQVEKLIDIRSYPVVNVLSKLLEDKATKRNIIWATDTYSEYGEEFTDKMQMNTNSLLWRPDIIRPRIQKTCEEQAQRTRKKAEVFTPVWLCNSMNNHFDEEWFGRSGVFNVENEDKTWTVTEGKIEFPKGKNWQRYVDSRRLEITCGEAPYLVSRYDASTGDLLVPPKCRIGILDRKIRIVNENTATHEDWVKWVIRAYESSYGYEYQGDNLLIARINLLLTFTNYYEERWKQLPDNKLLNRIANIIAWNIWQMDGLKDVVPLGKPLCEYKQLSLFDVFDEESEYEYKAAPCRIFNWRSNSSLNFMDLKGENMEKRLFDYIIGNPPYHEEAPGESTSEKPVYHLFMDASYSIGTCVELITPARFLFNAGGTPKDWNQKILNSPHFQVLDYDANAKNYFQNTAITGGIAVTIYDERKEVPAVGQFIPYKELTSICRKVLNKKGFSALSDIVSGRTPYLFTDTLHEEYPNAKSLLSKGHMYDISSNAFSSLPNIFLEKPLTDSEYYYRVLGRLNNERAYCYILKKYARGRIDNYVGKWKVFLPKANGASGMLGDEPARLISKPVIGEPNDIATDTFLCVGSFETPDEAKALLNYLYTKFARALLGSLKVTQINAKETWRNVPLQVFTSASEIDWTKSIHEIDLQLYDYYSLNEEEISFIEMHVKELM